MTKAVDWDVKQQTKQRKQNFVSQRINSLLATGYFFMPFLWSKFLWLKKNSVGSSTRVSNSFDQDQAWHFVWPDQSRSKVFAKVINREKAADQDLHLSK